MNKKIFTIFALLILVTSISAVSAFDLGDLFGMGGQNKTVTIEGVDFNIPAGYKEDSTNTFNIIEGFIDEGYNFDGKVYSKDKTEVGIFVYKNNPSDSSGNNDILGSFTNQTTINDIGGYIEFEDNDYVFVYTKEDCIVLIASTDQNVIGDFIIP